MSAILLIEDSMTQAERFKLMLEDAGHQTKHADSLAGGLQVVQEGDIDVILLDLTLPDSEGLKTFRTAHLCAPETPIVVLTSVDDEELAATALREGAQDYLVKGEVNQHWLIRSIQHAIARAPEKTQVVSSDVAPKSAPTRSVTVEHVGDVTVAQIEVQRLLDARDVTFFSERLLQSIKDGCSKMLIRFHHVDYVSNGAFGALIAIRKRMQSQNGTILLCEVSSNVYDQLALRQLHRLFKFHANVESAMEILSES